MITNRWLSKMCKGPTSHCFALKNVAGPTGGPSSGGIMTRR